MLDELVELLRLHGGTRVADVRTIPRSRRYPQFSSDALARELGAAGIGYRHFPGLGGLRKPRPDSTNTAWKNASFRGYADYMETPAFAQALDELVDWAQRNGTDGRVAVMCAEAVWWRCHRQLVADALVARGVPVAHIVSKAPPEPHALTRFARVSGASVRYPGLV
jgi:uncharacterized protein (DUF488 family)